MKTLTTIIRLCGYALLAAGVLLIAVGFIGIAARDGIMEALSIFSPFNIWNWLAVMATLAPGGFLLFIADKIGGSGNGA
ncbi:hypothetical protein [Bythopirellula goksoeyrii]|uniref:Uncharacterized protein n=1 Tax=Bythopirellula goksoeyrii TaxID=1400387 RepID=A0A5B9Q9L9_9BACT|nr:hypothetical protein [Bythopirellula goksoeyrii]QEG34102.1 hypothetical protein Pr1d_13740 [Bythopirellula goksoeyrii]